jgi:hypothetical protein
MALFWLTLAFFGALTIGSSVFATRRGIDLFRAFRHLTRGIGAELETIDRATDQVERHLSLAAESGTRLDASLARLRASRARLNVQRAAIADVRSAFARITALAPRK